MKKKTAPRLFDMQVGAKIAKSDILYYLILGESCCNLSYLLQMKYIRHGFSMF